LKISAVSGLEHAELDVSSWSFATAADAKDAEVEVSLGDQSLGSFPPDNTVQVALPGFDVTGRAHVDVALPDACPPETSYSP